MLLFKIYINVSYFYLEQKLLPEGLIVFHFVCIRFLRLFHSGSECEYNSKYKYH